MDSSDAPDVDRDRPIEHAPRSGRRRAGTPARLCRPLATIWWGAVGTSKRERQKANRAQRRAEDARAQRRNKIQRTGLQWGVGIVAAFAAVLLIAWLTGAFGGDDTSQSDAEPIPTPSETIPIDSLPIDSLPTESAPASTVAAAEPVCPPADGTAVKTNMFTAAPETCIDPTKTYTAEIVTNKGTLTVDLLTDKAPNTVNNFVFLSRYHFYDATDCHRIIPGFMAQCGDPTGTGGGDAGYKFADELPAEGEYKVGSLAMANSGPDTQGTQFFIITGSQGVSLPPDYTLFGQVTDGLDDTLAALDQAGNPDPAANGQPPVEQVTIESISITES